jgi:hypothetical protein
MKLLIKSHSKIIKNYSKLVKQNHMEKSTEKKIIYCLRNLIYKLLKVIPLSLKVVYFFNSGRLAAVI